MHSPTRPPSATWAYQPPRTAADYPNQQYYREQRISDAWGSLPCIALLRFKGREETKLTLRVGSEIGDAEISLTLTRQQLITLVGAGRDALSDIEAEDQQRELQDAFDAIRDELSENDVSACVRYAHPWVHYVTAEHVQAKVAELEASGTPFLVLAESGTQITLDGAPA